MGDHCLGTERFDIFYEHVTALFLKTHGGKQTVPALEFFLKRYKKIQYSRYDSEEKHYLKEKSISIMFIAQFDTRMIVQTAVLEEIKEDFKIEANCAM